MDRVRICQGVWIRCLALVIDVVVVGAVTLLASLLVYLVVLGRGDGAKLGTGGPCVRNLLRIADWLPFFYVLAAAVIWAAPSNQRIGDVAARSVVVRTKLVSVSRLDDATLSVVPWWALISSRRAPSPRRP